MKEEYKEPPKIGKTDFEKMFDYKVNLPSNYDLFLKEQEDLKPKSPEEIAFEKQDKITVSWNFKF